MHGLRRRSSRHAPRIAADRTPEAAEEPSADVVALAAPGTVEAEAIEVHDALVFQGEVLEVTADEAAKLSAYLTQLRMEARKAA